MAAVQPGGERGISVAAANPGELAAAAAEARGRWRAGWQEDKLRLAGDGARRALLGPEMRRHGVGPTRAGSRKMRKRCWLPMGQKL